MKYFSKILCFFVSIFAFLNSSFAFAQNTSAEKLVRYLTAPKQEILVENKDILRIWFPIDEKKCKEMYGDNAYEICGRSINAPLPIVNNAISLSPAKEGTWKWESDTNLIFIPKTPWTPDTTYSVMFGKNALPKNTELGAKIVFKTKPLQARISGEFKINPENHKEKFLSGVVRFNYPVKRDTVLSRLNIAQAKGSQISLGKLETTFDISNTFFTFSIPVTGIAQKAENVDFQIFSGIQASYGGSLANNASLALKVPSREEIFYVAGSRTGIEKLSDMSAKQIVDVEFSLPIIPVNVLENTTVYLLPRQRVENSSTVDKTPYTWWSKSEITDEVLQKAEKLSVRVLGNPHEENRFLRLILPKDIEAGRGIFIKIDAPINGPENYILNSQVTILEKVPSLNSVVKVMQQGSLLSLEGDKKLSLYARNADVIEYEIKQIRPELLNVFVPSLYAGVKNINFNYAELSIVTKGKIPLQYENAEKAQFASLDLGQFIKNNAKGFFYVTLIAKKGDKYVAEDNRFIMLTDIGIILKKNVSNDNAVVYAVSLEFGKPIANAKVTAIGRNGIAVFTGKTNSDGFVALPSLSDYILEKEVTALTIENNTDMAFIPYGFYNTELRPLNTVNTNGKMLINDGLYGFAFSQRDIYRPGETAHFGFIVKQQNFENAIVNEMPLNAVIRSSRGQIIAKKQVKLVSGGFGEFSFALPQNAISGVYQFSLEQADSSQVIVYKDFSVTEFQPDSIKVKAEHNIGIEKKWYTPEEVKELAFSIKAENLFGSPAINSQVKASLNASPVQFAFEKYKDWKFFDSAKLSQSLSLALEDTRTDSTGKAVYKVPSDFLGNSSAIIRFNAEVFDAGSSSVMARDSIIVSPVKAVVGYKTTSNLRYLAKGESANLSLIALDAMQSPTSYAQLTAELYHVDRTKSLVKAGNGEYRYSIVAKEKLVQSTTISLAKNGANFSLNTSATGEKVLLLKDTAQRVVLRVPYIVIGDSQVQFDTYKNADLQAFLDKNSYQAGDDIRVSMKLPYEGAGLITIERDSVITQKWFRADKGEHTEKLSVPQSLEGKAYINIVYFRSIEDSDIFTEPSASVVLPFTYNVKKRELALDVQIGDGSKDFIAKPGSEIPVQVKAKEKAKVLVYAVDEGILQLTKYQAPNPIYELLIDRALEVNTYQFLDLLMPEYSLVQKHLAKFGGDSMLNAMADSMRKGASNPFKVKNQKPAVFWSGLLDVDANGTTVNIPVPETFNGNLRVFVVASSDKAVNVVQKDVLCQAEIIMQPYMPLFVSPNDVFEAKVVLTDMRKNSDTQNSSVSVEADFGSAFTVINGNSKEISLDKTKQNVVSFTVQANNNDRVLGEHSIMFTVIDKAKAQAIAIPATISVRPASALITQVQIGKMEKQGDEYSAIVENTRELYPQFATLSASVSSLPIPYVQAILQRAEKSFYPQISQNVGKAFAKLLVLQNKDFAPVGDAFTEKAIQKEIIETINMLEQRVDRTSGFYAYGTYGQVNLYELIFIADFLTTANEMGINVPEYLLRDTLSKVSEKISVRPEDVVQAREFAYGAWVLTRNGIITSNIMANLTSFMADNKDFERDIVASLMGASMKLMMYDDVANRFVSSYQPSALKAWNSVQGINGLTERALYVSLVAKHFPNLLKSEKVQSIMNDIYALTARTNTINTEALAVRSMIAYSQTLQNAESEYAVVFTTKTNGTITPKGEKTKSGYSVLDTAGNIIVSTKLSSSSQPAFYSVVSTGYDKERQTLANPQIEISREFRDVDGYKVTNFTVGSDIVVVIKARSLVGDLENVLITDILPAGFEFIVPKNNAVPFIRTHEGKSNEDVLEEEQDMRVDFADQQQDRLVLLANINANTTVFRYKVRVVNKGEFIMPDLIAEQVGNALVRGKDNNALSAKLVVAE